MTVALLVAALAALLPQAHGIMCRAIIVGNGTSTSGGNGGDANLATVRQPHGIAVDTSTNAVFILELGFKQVRPVTRIEGEMENRRLRATFHGFCFPTCTGSPHPSHHQRHLGVRGDGDAGLQC